MNNHQNTDCYATPSISILGSLTELTKTLIRTTSSGWEDNDNQEM